MSTVTFESTSNFDEDSAQHVGVELLTLECDWVDFDWGGLAIAPLGKGHLGEVLYVAQLVQPLTNEDGVNTGAGWMILTEDEFERTDPEGHALRLWPELRKVMGCTFSRMYSGDLG